jgi:putative hemolysin
MDGHPLGCFPSGAVSDFDLKTWSIQDRNWQKSMLRIIKRSKVPVVPVHFLNGNSVFYYILGLISWKIRVLRLPHEYFNKNKGKHHLVIGDVISVEEQDKYTDLEEYGRMLRSRVYDMPVPASYTSRSEYIASELKSLSNEKES